MKGKKRKQRRKERREGEMREHVFQLTFVNFATFPRDLSGTGNGENQWSLSLFK